MRALYGRTVFTCGGAEYDWTDVVLGAMLRGDWAALTRATAHGLACLARAEATGDPPSRAEVEREANEFRYGRELLSAEETEAWLARWGLTVDAWLDWIAVAVARERYDADGDVGLTREAATDDAIAAAIGPEAVCGGWLLRFAEALAARAAVHARTEPTGDAPAAGSAGTVEPPLVATIDLLAASRAALPVESCVGRLDRLGRLEASFARFRRDALAPRAIDAEVAAHRLEWVRVDGECLTFAEHAAAREALLCVREDGATLDDVARWSGTHVDMRSWWLEELPPAVAGQLLGADAGDVIGPLALDAGHAVVLVRARTVPSAADASMRRRAEARLRRRIAEQEVASRVRWDAGWTERHGAGGLAHAAR